MRKQTVFSMTSNENGSVSVDEPALLKIHGEGGQNGKKKGFLFDHKITDKSYAKNPRAIISFYTFRHLRAKADDIHGVVVEPDGKDRRMLRYSVHRGVVLASYPDKCKCHDSKKEKERWWEYPIGYSEGLQAFLSEGGKKEYIGEVYDSPDLRPIPEAGKQYQDTWPVLYAVVFNGTKIYSHMPIVEVQRNERFLPTKSLRERVQDTLGLDVLVGERIFTKKNVEMREGAPLQISHNYYLCVVQEEASDKSKNGKNWISVDRYSPRIDTALRRAVLQTKS